MLYGRNDGPTGLLVAAADTLANFKAFENPSVPHERIEPDFLALMRDDRFNRFKYPPRLYVFPTAADRDAYVGDANISIETVQRLVDLNEAMVAAENERMSSEDSRTIGEIHGLDKNDPWDKRSDAEKERDKATKELIEKAKAEGKLSGDDSFAPVHDKKKGGVGRVTVTEVEKAGGGATITVSVRKHESKDSEKPGLVTELVDPLAVYNRVFVTGRASDELRDLLGPVLFGMIRKSEDTDTGCWADFILQRHALEAVAAAKDAGFEGTTITVNGLGEQLLPEGTRVVDEKEARVIGPRPWKDAAEWADMDDASRAEEIEKVSPDEFLMCGYSRGLYGSRVYFIPKTYWMEHEDFWTGEMFLDGLVPKLMKNVATENHPGRYDSTMNWNSLSLTLNKMGFREDMMFQIHVNGIKMFP